MGMVDMISLLWGIYEGVLIMELSMLLVVGEIKLNGKMISTCGLGEVLRDWFLVMIGYISEMLPGGRMMAGIEQTWLGGMLVPEW